MRAMAVRIEKKDLLYEQFYLQQIYSVQNKREKSY